MALWEYKSPSDVSLKNTLDHRDGIGVWSVDIDEIHIISGSGGGIIKVKCHQAGYKC